MTKALVVGAGAIGARHAEVLAALGHEVAFVSARQDLELPVFSDLRPALDEFDPGYVVVATETALHGSTVTHLADLGFHGTLLVEKPFAVPAPVMSAAAFARVGVGFNLRFHPVLVGLRQALADAEVFTVEAYAGQDFASWRPTRALEAQYSSSKARGGGVLRDLSHELDYLAWLLGECQGVFALGGRLAEITQDSDDAWGVVARHERAPVVTLQLNYLDTVRRRRIVLNTSTGTIEADLVAGFLRINDREESLDSDRNDTYRAMHAAMLDDSDASVATAQEAIATDETIAMIERSASERRWVERS